MTKRARVFSTTNAIRALSRLINTARLQLVETLETNGSLRADFMMASRNKYVLQQRAGYTTATDSAALMNSDGRTATMKRTIEKRAREK